MSGELHETVYDSGFKPDLSSAHAVLAFMLTPVEVVGPLEPHEVEPVTEMFNAAKRTAFYEWQRLNKR